jgi:hypothetical protein
MAKKKYGLNAVSQDMLVPGQATRRAVRAGPAFRVEHGVDQGPVYSPGRQGAIRITSVTPRSPMPISRRPVISSSPRKLVQPIKAPRTLGSPSASLVAGAGGITAPKRVQPITKPSFKAPRKRTY